MGTAAWYELMQGLAYLGDMLDKMWAILTASPQSFKGGTIWSIIETINGVLGAVGTALLVLFFTIGVIKTCGSFAELKKPETAVKVFIRFAIAKALVDNCLKLLVNFVIIVQSVISTITTAIALIVISMVLLLTVYGRFFRIFIYAAIAPIPLSTIAGQPTENIGKSFLKSFAGVCLQGVVIVLACIIFTAYAASSPTAIDTTLEPIEMVWGYVVSVVFNMLVLLGLVKGSDRIIHDMMGL